MTEHKQYIKFIRGEFNIDMDYSPPAKLIPYRTRERALYGRTSVFKTFNEISDKERERFAENKEAFREVNALLRKYKLNKSIIAVKDSVDSTSVYFVPRKVHIEDINSHWKKISLALFHYSIDENAVVDYKIYKFRNRYGFKITDKVSYKIDYYGEHYLNFENIEKLVQVIAKIREQVASLFLQKNHIMTDNDFAWILTLMFFHEKQYIQGSVKSWVRYIAKGYNLYEVLYAFNDELYKINKRPVPMGLLKEHITEAPIDWVKILLTKHS